MSKLFHVPLEKYPSRYTMQLQDWYNRNWDKVCLDYQTIENFDTGDLNYIHDGQVVDASARAETCFGQVLRILAMLKDGAITENDVLLFDDFWTPGLEMIPYFCQVAGLVRPRMYAYCWAQSVDQFDFTFPMRQWIRSIERGYASIYDGVFVACPSMGELLIDCNICEAAKVHAVGLPFSSEEVLERMPKAYRDSRTGKTFNKGRRKTQVVFSSRWDQEKNPLFFIDVMKEVIDNRNENVQFVICTSAPELRSNNPKLIEVLEKFREAYPDNLIVKTGLSKEEYYKILTESKVQMNTADQDWVSFTLLEASVAGCFPVYPYFRSFPETFKHEPNCMYVHKDVESAVTLLMRVLNREDLWTPAHLKEREWVHKRFDLTWLRMLDVMELIPIPFGGTEEGEALIKECRKPIFK